MLPIARFAGLAWLSVIAFVLPRTRHEVRDRRESPATASRTV
jgi:hypothetical protein